MRGVGGARTCPAPGRPRETRTLTGKVATTMAEMVKVTQRRSMIGVKPKLRATVRALGLRGIGTSNVVPDNDATRGMIKAVSHLVESEPSEGQ